MVATGIVSIPLMKRAGVPAHKAGAVEAVASTGGQLMPPVMGVICGAAGIVIGVLSISGFGYQLTLILVQVGQGDLLLLLLLSAIVCIILGMGLPTVGVYVLLAALVAPSLIEAGVQPIAAHMYVLYFGMMSMITPPIAIAAFAAASLAGADAMRTGFAACRFGWTAFIVPVLFVFSPSLLMVGEAGTIAWTFATFSAGADAP